MTLEKRKIALVTGANRGLGLETCRQLAQKDFRVILTSRDEEKGRAAAQALSKSGAEIVAMTLDVADSSSIARLTSEIEKDFGRLDVLVNNAGIMPEHGTHHTRMSAFDADPETVRESFVNNTLGAFQLCQRLIPLMRKHHFGRVVNVSSGMGQLSEMDGGYPAYRLSKTALNAVTKIFAAETKGDNILVNSVCPGWVRTDMGGAGAPRSVEQGADTIVWAASLPDGGPSGQFFRDRKPIEW